MNYTAIGDPVNLAKRLQERAEPGEILVEEGVVSRLGDLVHSQKVGEFQVKGRMSPVVVYRLNGLA
jgi:class 3 adenylate cyclase